MTNKEIKQILNECQNKKYIYIDCYDTIIHRKYSITYAFKILANYLKQEFDFEESLDQISLSLKHIFFKCDLSFDEHVKNVYLHYNKYITISFEQFYLNFKNIFVDSEINNSLIDNGTLNLLKRLKEKNKKIFLLSDFFIGKEYINNLFEKFNILDLFDDIYVSSDLKKTKSDGSLYTVIKDKNQSIMIGDNKYSDFLIPQSLGIESFLVDAYKFKNNYNLFDNSYDEKCYDKYLELSNLKNGEFAVNYKFIFFAFCKGLYQKLQQDDIVYFLARDGKFLKDCFDTYLKYYNLKNIKTRYISVSRIALMIASIDVNKLNFQEFGTIFKNHTNWNIKSNAQFLEALGFNSANLNKFLNESVEVDDYFNSSYFDKLYNSEEFKEIFKERQKIAKTKFLSLVSKRNQNRLVTVDMGWRGTSQNDMRMLLPNDVKLFGYYIGTSDCIGEIENSYKFGILFDYFNNIKFKSNYSEIEGVLKTDQKQLLCYGDSTDYYLSDNGLKVFYEFSKKIQDGIISNFCELVKLDLCFPCSKEKILDFFHILERKESVKDIALLRFYWIKQNTNENLKFGIKDYLLGYKEYLRRKNAIIYRLGKKIKHIL